jgi:hypothetical protein
VTPARLARLRGSLPDEEPGARGLERVARNPGCQRLRALTMIRVTPATVVSRVYGEPHREGQSPFALAVGNRFERVLFDNGAARLFRLYQKASRLTATECKIVVIPGVVPGVTAADMARRRAETELLLELKARRDPTRPTSS